MQKFLKNKKIIIFLIGIAITVASIIYTNKNKEQSYDNNYEDLKSNFNSIFDNKLHNQTVMQNTDGSINYDELIELKYDFTHKKNGQYDINTKIPMFKIETEATKFVNDQIYKIFVPKIFEIVESETYTIYNIDYVAYINNNIVSLVIRCTLKEGAKPQRLILQTYNYDIKNDKLITLEDIINIKKLDINTVQEKINAQIILLSEKTQNVGTVYKRNIQDEMYKIENTVGYFIGQSGYLYIIYAYGNNNFTNEKDIIIF